MKFSGGEGYKIRYFPGESTSHVLFMRNIIAIPKSGRCYIFSQGNTSMISKIIIPHYKFISCDDHDVSQ